jgi:enoyl-[acyl-carrier protein] reductase I
MGLMTGKRGVIFGIANDRSYAWYIAKQLLAQGAELGFTYLPLGKMERRFTKAVEELGVANPWVMPCDAGKDEDLTAVFNKIGQDWGKLDFVVHSIAFAEREFLRIGNFHTTTRAAFTQAMDISAYTLLAMAQRAAPLMTGGGSIVSMTYYGGEKVIPGYNVRGVAKAALEHTTRRSWARRTSASTRSPAGRCGRSPLPPSATWTPCSSTRPARPRSSGTSPARKSATRRCIC